MNSNGSLFYWCTTVSTLLIFALVPLVWFKKVWDFCRPSHETDASKTIPPKNRALLALYEFSFDIMSNAVYRTLIYLFVVIILVVVSLLHLVRNCSLLASQRVLCAIEQQKNAIKSSCLHSQVECSDEASGKHQESREHRLPCLNSWVVKWNSRLIDD